MLAVMAQVVEREAAVLGVIPDLPNRPGSPESIFTRWTAAVRDAARGGGANSPAR